LYEFAFKPRIELVLRSDPVFNDCFNANLGSLDEMSEVEAEEAEKMKMFLGALEKKEDLIQEIDMGVIKNTELEKTQGSIGGTSRVGSKGFEEGSLHGGRLDTDPNPPIDFRKVGKLHAADAPLQNVIDAEMMRIHKAFDERLNLHTNELLTRVQNGQPIGGGEAPANASQMKKK